MSWLVLAPAAGQDALPLQLTWQAPSDCPSEARVREELARIARARSGHTLEPLAARVYVSTAGRRYRALLQTDHGGQWGERTLTAADCQTLLKSVTLVLALTFGAGVEIDSAPVAGDDPARAEAAAVQVTPAANPGPTPREERTPAPSATTVAPRALVVAAPPGRMDLRGGLLLGAGAHFRSLLRTALTITGGATLEHDRFRADLRALGLLARERGIGADVEADLDGLAVAASACAQHGAQIAAALCGGGQAGLLWGRTAAVHAAPRAPLYALSTHVAGTWPARGLVRLRLEAGLTIALNRPLFVVEDLGVVQRLPRVAPELSLLLVRTP